MEKKQPAVPLLDCKSMVCQQVPCRCTVRPLFSGFIQYAFFQIALYAHSVVCSAAFRTPRTKTDYRALVTSMSYAFQDQQTAYDDAKNWISEHSSLWRMGDALETDVSLFYTVNNSQYSGQNEERVRRAYQGQQWKQASASKEH